MSELSSIEVTSVQAAKQRSTKYPLYVFWVLFIISMLNSIDRYVLTGAANVIGIELHLGIDQIGYLSSAFVLLFTFSVVPFGILADRIKRKDVIAAAVTVWSLATVFTVLARSFSTLFLARSVLGVGEAGYSPSSQALLSDYFRQKNRGQVMGWWAVSGQVGLLIGILLGGIIAGLYPGAWHLAFLVAGIPGLLMALIAWRLREPRRNQADEEADLLATHTSLQEAEIVGETYLAEKPQTVIAQFLVLIRNKSLVVLTIMQIFSLFVLGGTVTYLSIFMQQKDTFGLTSAQAAIFTGFAVLLAASVGVIAGGYLADWWMRYFIGARVLVSGIGLLLSMPTYAAAVLIAVYSHNLVWYTVFFSLSAILLNLGTGPTAAATQEVVPTMLRGSAVAVSLFLSHILGDAFSAPVIGVLARSFDPTGLHFQHSVAGYDLMLALIFLFPPALAIAGIVAIFGSRWVNSDMKAAKLMDLQGTSL
jgi:MFS transporter, Spinster family, sphingosine-1-phosphate transporter